MEALPPPLAAFSADYHLCAQQILPHVWLGPVHAAKDSAWCRDVGLTGVLSVMLEAPSTPADDGLDQLVIEVADDNKASLAPVLGQAFTFLDKHAAMDGGQVLVHCSSGISRSGCVTIGYTMHNRKCSLAEAFEVTADRRPCVLPNDTFFAALIDLEKRIHGVGEASMDQNDYNAYSLASMTRKPPAKCREVLAASGGDVGAAAAQLFGG